MAHWLRRLVATAVVVGLCGVCWKGNWLPVYTSWQYVSALQSFWKTGNPHVKEQFGFLSQSHVYLGRQAFIYSLRRDVISRVILEQAKEHPELSYEAFQLARELQKTSPSMKSITDLNDQGALHILMFLVSGDRTYLSLAETQFLEAQAISPQFPDTLLGLFDVYQLRGDNEKKDAIKGQILQIWPQQEALVAYLNGQSKKH